MKASRGCSDIRVKNLSILVTFRCGEALCAFPRQQVVRLLALPALSQPPSMPPTLAGFANIAGGAVPVVDTARLLGVDVDSEADPLYRHIIVIAADGAPLGLLVDRVLDVQEGDLGALSAPRPGTVLNDCVSGDLVSEGQTFHVLDAERILMAFERIRIAELRDAEQQRLAQWGAS